MNFPIRHSRRSQDQIARRRSLLILRTLSEFEMKNFFKVQPVTSSNGQKSFQPESYSCADMMICEVDLTSQLGKFTSLSIGSCRHKWNLSPTKKADAGQKKLRIASASEKVCEVFRSFFCVF